MIRVHPSFFGPLNLEPIDFFEGFGIPLGRFLLCGGRKRPSNPGADTA
jgi:hypothetical protein